MRHLPPPSFPASRGCLRASPRPCVNHPTLRVQAVVGLERGGECFSNPVYPDDDGLELLDWNGECLTYEGEINKLAANVAFGRYV